METNHTNAAALITDPVLDHFRQLAAAMQTEPTDWQWIGKWVSQRHFGITKTRALEYQSKHGGEARQM